MSMNLYAGIEKEAIFRPLTKKLYTGATRIAGRAMTGPVGRTILGEVSRGSISGIPDLAMTAATAYGLPAIAKHAPKITKPVAAGIKKGLTTTGAVAAKGIQTLGKTSPISPRF